MEIAAERRARLRALREASLATEGPSAAAATVELSGLNEEPVLKFRNYALAAEERIQHEKVEVAHIPEFEEVKVDVDPALGEDPEVRRQPLCPSAERSFRPPSPRNFHSTGQVDVVAFKGHNG